MSNEVGRIWRSVVLYVLLFEFSWLPSSIRKAFGWYQIKCFMYGVDCVPMYYTRCKSKTRKKNSFCTLIVAGDLWWVVYVSIYYIIFLQAPSKFFMEQWSHRLSITIMIVSLECNDTLMGKWHVHHFHFPPQHRTVRYWWTVGFDIGFL